MLNITFLISALIFALLICMILRAVAEQPIMEIRKLGFYVEYIIMTIIIYLFIIGLKYLFIITNLIKF